MRLCTCGHRDARHDQLIGGCLACSCGVFDDVRSSIEEEIPALTPGTPEHAEYVAEAQLLAEVDVAVLEDVMTPGMPDPCQPIGCDNGFHLPGCVYAERDLEPLESFNAWRCPGCGSRSFKRQRCEVLPSCRSRWLEPVRVEIHSRDAP